MDALRILFHRLATEIPPWQWALTVACAVIPIIIIFGRRWWGERYDHASRIVLAGWLVLLGCAAVAWQIVALRFVLVVLGAGVALMGVAMWSVMRDQP